MSAQDKAKEISFFNQVAESESEYNVFTANSTEYIARFCADFAGFTPKQKIADFGCGSGVFSNELMKFGFDVTGIDLSPKLIQVAQAKYPKCKFMVGDVENLNCQSGSFDGVFLGAIIHHFPDPSGLAKEVFRILKPGGKFVAFDPNRKNPFMWVYRDKNSPLYSNKGVTENERPILANEVRQIFESAGFKTQARFMSGLHFKYVESRLARFALPVYNWTDSLLCKYIFPQDWGTFVVTQGTKL